MSDKVSRWAASGTFCSYCGKPATTMGQVTVSALDSPKYSAAFVYGCDDHEVKSYTVHLGPNRMKPIAPAERSA